MCLDNAYPTEYSVTVFSPSTSLNDFVAGNCSIAVVVARLSDIFVDHAVDQEIGVAADVEIVADHSTGTKKYIVASGDTARESSTRSKVVVAPGVYRMSKIGTATHDIEVTHGAVPSHIHKGIYPDALPQTVEFFYHCTVMYISGPTVQLMVVRSKKVPAVHGVVESQKHLGTLWHQVEVSVFQIDYLLDTFAI